MKAKLIKHDFGYNLVDTNSKHIATSKDKYSNGVNQDYWLSVKNCQAIECGYDLDELAENFWKEEFMKLGLIDTNSFKAGFQKALEILGDNKFSEDNMRKAYREGYYDEHSIEVVIQSLQQTEWEVEIITEPMNLDEIRKQGKGFLNSNTNKPKLDADGCLILRGLENLK